MMNEYIVTANKIGFIKEESTEDQRTFHIAGAGMATYKDLMIRLLDLWGDKKIKIDNEGHVSGCQIFLNGRIMRNLNVPLNFNLTAVDITFVRAMSGG